MNPVFVIAECGSCWRFGDDHLANAYRMIEAAKECGADAAKFQWCSDGRQLAIRRSGRKHEYDQGECGDDQCPTCLEGEMYERYIDYPREWLSLMKAKCDEVGIEYMCTAFIPEDVSVVAKLVKRFKVAAKESMDTTLREEIRRVQDGREVIVSVSQATSFKDCWNDYDVTRLHCISDYPCKLENLHLRMMDPEDGWSRQGLSDHCANVITGAVAVGAGATTIEAHIRLPATPKDNPDYPHSHSVESGCGCCEPEGFPEYVGFIREAEKML